MGMTWNRVPSNVLRNDDEITRVGSLALRDKTYKQILDTRR